MYEFEYEAFDFLTKFQDEIAAKIFVLEDKTGFEFYYVESGIIFSSYITYERILEHMNEVHGIEILSDAIIMFKQIYFKDISEPISVKKDSEPKIKEKEQLSITVIIAEKKVNFIFV